MIARSSFAYVAARRVNAVRKKVPKASRFIATTARHMFVYGSDDFSLGRIERDPRTKTVVVIHLYYPDTWPTFLKALQALRGRTYDLCITLPEHNEYFIDEILKDRPGAYIFVCPNRGRDGLPFVRVARLLQAAGYEYVLKVHSKKSPHRTDGDKWLGELVGNLLPRDKTAIKELFTALARPDTGVIGPAGHYISLMVNLEANQADISSILNRAYSSEQSTKVMEKPQNYGFFEGTMFWARLDAIWPVTRAHGRVFEYALEARQEDGTLAHAIERAFSLGPEVEGRAMYEISPKGVRPIKKYATKNIPDWSKVYIGQN